jgi:hypothetical protein
LKEKEKKIRNAKVFVDLDNTGNQPVLPQASQPTFNPDGWHTHSEV